MEEEDSFGPSPPVLFTEHPPQHVHTPHPQWREPSRVPYLPHSTDWSLHQHSIDTEWSSGHHNDATGDDT